MSDLMMDEDGDLAVVNNDIPIVDGADEVRQLLLQRLRTFLGEYFLDTSIGVPYFQEILVKGAQMGVVAGIFKTVILSTEGVLELTNFTLDLIASTRKLTLDFTVRTENGPITVTEVV